MPQDTWETEEVIRWLINNEEAYTQLTNASASEIQRYVVTDHRAPAGLYDSFDTPPRSSWKSVNWSSVAQALAEEDAAGPMQTMEEVQTYLTQERDLAGSIPGSPEYQVFTSLLNLAGTCQTVAEFTAQASALPIEGPVEETKEAKQWLQIALDTIAGH